MVAQSSTTPVVGCMKKILFPLLFGGVVAIATPAYAQYDPGASLMLGQGMGYSALSASTLRNSIEATKGNNREGTRSGSASRKNRSDQTKQGTQKATPQAEGRKPGDPVLRNQADVDRYMKSRMLHHARALEPEYKRRAARDGTAAADKWIRERGEALGKMEGERARRFVQRD